MNYLQLISPLIALGINVLVQISSFRFISKLGLLKSIMLGFLLGILTVFGIDLTQYFNLLIPEKDFFFFLLTNVVIYSFLGYCYFHFINLIVTARRIRLIRELYKFKNGLSEQEILKRYNAKKMVQYRLKRLLSSGQVVYRNERYYIGKPIMLFIAKILVMLKFFFIGKKTVDF